MVSLKVSLPKVVVSVGLCSLQIVSLTCMYSCAAGGCI